MFMRTRLIKTVDGFLMELQICEQRGYRLFVSVLYRTRSYVKGAAK